MRGYYSALDSTLCADWYNSENYQMLHTESRSFTFGKPVSDWVLYLHPQFPQYDAKIRFYFERPEDDGKRFTLNLDGTLNGRKKNDFLTYRYGGFPGEGRGGEGNGGEEYEVA